VLSKMQNPYKCRVWSWRRGSFRFLPFLVRYGVFASLSGRYSSALAIPLFYRHAVLIPTPRSGFLSRRRRRLHRWPFRGRARPRPVPRHSRRGRLHHRKTLQETNWDAFLRHGHNL